MSYRYLNIDYTKGILTMGMVFGHVFLILGNGQSRLVKMILSLLSPAIFSGFMFCFGFVIWISYLNKKSIPWVSVLKTFLKCYLAFIVSGLAWEILGAEQNTDWNLLTSVSFIRVVPSYSEFLLAFALITIIAAVFAPAINIFIRSKTNLTVSIIAFLAFTPLPEKAVYDPIAALFIGGQGYYFPIFQHMPIFLLGAYLAKWEHNYNFIYVAISLITVEVYCCLNFLEIPPRRFPPSTVWILISLASSYIYYGLGQFIDAFFPNILKHYLRITGQNTLYYLVFSNIIIFVAVAMGLAQTFNALHSLTFYVGTMFFLFCLQYLAMALNRARATAQSRVQKAESVWVGEV